MTTTDRWEPRIAAERLAEFHATVLDYVGRVDQAVTRGDLFYLIDKGRPLVDAVERLMKLAEELREENTPIQPHLPLVEDYLVRVGQQGYRAIAALHPPVAPEGIEPRGTLDHVAEITRGRVECLGGNVYGAVVPVGTAHGLAQLMITSNEDQDGYVISACTAPDRHDEDGCLDSEFTCVDDDEAIRTAVDAALSWLARGGDRAAVTS